MLLRVYVCEGVNIEIYSIYVCMRACVCIYVCVHECYNSYRVIYDLAVSPQATPSMNPFPVFDGHDELRFLWGILTHTPARAHKQGSDMSLTEKRYHYNNIIIYIYYDILYIYIY